MHVTVSDCSILAALLSPFRHASVCPPFPAGWWPDLGGERPQLSGYPAWRSRQGPEVITAPDDDGQRCGPPAARQDSCGRDQVDCQLADRRELCQQQRGRVSFDYLFLLQLANTNTISNQTVHNHKVFRQSIIQSNKILKLRELSISNLQCT